MIYTERYFSGDVFFLNHIMHLHLFNPENDLALAAKGNYTPPKNATLLARSGELLPAWLASPGDYVLVENAAAYNGNPVLEKLGVKATDTAKGFTSFSPWGWSKYARGIYASKGADAGLPDNVRLESHRNLSHRRTAADLNLRLREKLSFDIPEPAVEITDFSQMKKINFPCYIKSPWSSSGRGVFHINSVPATDLEQRIRGMIRNQGSVMVERALDRVRDFAMLFNINECGCRFIGYSLFSNNGTSYSGNILASDFELKSILASLVNIDFLNELEETLPDILNKLYAGRYNGNLGIDMMVYTNKKSGENAVAPTIEINLRNTMGFIAKTFSDKLLHPGKKGLFSIAFGENTPTCMPEFESGRLIAGNYLPIGKTKGFSFVVNVF